MELKVDLELDDDDEVPGSQNSVVHQLLFTSAA